MASGNIDSPTPEGNHHKEYNECEDWRQDDKQITIYEDPDRYYIIYNHGLIERVKEPKLDSKTGQRAIQVQVNCYTCKNSHMYFAS